MQVDAANFVPSLDADSLEKIDAVIQRSKGMSDSITKYRGEVGGRDALHAEVFNADGVPFLGPVSK